MRRRKLLKNLELRKIKLFKDLFLDGKYPLFWCMEQIRILEILRKRRSGRRLLGNLREIIAED